VLWYVIFNTDEHFDIAVFLHTDNLVYVIRIRADRRPWQDGYGQQDSQVGTQTAFQNWAMDPEAPVSNHCRHLRLSRQTMWRAKEEENTLTLASGSQPIASMFMVKYNCIIRHAIT